MLNVSSRLLGKCVSGISPALASSPASVIIWAGLLPSVNLDHMMALSQIWDHFKKRMALIPAGADEASNNVTSIHRPLERGEIRVVKLAPGKWTNQIKCTLRTVSLDINPAYETLSYVWGSTTIKKPILLQGHEFQITNSLETALRHLRHKHKERTIWIDAICINQNDDAEKTEQVKMMPFIYARTSHLVIWVGNASDDSNLGMETIKVLAEELKESSFEDVDLAKASLVKDIPEKAEDFNPRPWLAINRLFRREWFERVWVIQEVCMPDSPISFVCGSQSVPWDSASRVFHAIQSYRLDRLGLKRYFTLIEKGYSYSNIETPVNLIREVYSSQSRFAEAHSTLMTNLWAFRSRKCGDPRDKVYAILGICKDLVSGDITIDYSSPVSRVYSEVAKFLMERDGTLELLSACQSFGSTVEDLPTWVPDWSIDARYRPLRTVWRLESGEGMTQLFHASGNSPAQLQISDDLKKMTVHGLVIGAISVLGTHLGNDGDNPETPESQEKLFTLFKTWWPLAKTHTSEVSAAGERRIDTFWRTIITDMKNSVWQRASQHEEGAQFRRWMAVHDPSAFEPEDLTTEAKGEDIIGFLASFQQATPNRSFFITTEGQMGLGPRLTEPGDVVCVLFGSQVPFVLREVDDHYLLIGECYCHGIMEGEAVVGLEDGRFPRRDFTLW